jgi:hypothetical protein
MRQIRFLRRIKRRAVVFVLMAVPLFGGAGLAQVSSIGPGVAGQVKALAYDPDVLDRIYAGGDVCGVYVSNDNGRSWELINRGLESSDRTRSFYVDDLIVIGNDEGIPASRRGVYAATHGGIYFLGQSASAWTLLTPPPVYWYRETNCGSGYNCVYGLRGGPIPYSCFGYDAASGVLYAGAGNGGSDSPSSPWIYYYPEADGCTAVQYALWSLDLTSAVSTWQPVAGSENSVGITRQITFVDADDGLGGTQHLVVVAARGGLFTFDPVSGVTANIATMYGKQRDPGVLWSDKVRGVATGSNSILYSIFSENLEQLEETDIRPGVWWVDMSLPPASRTFKLLNADVAVPPRDITWRTILEHTGTDLYSITVIPGDEQEPDQVFVGTTGTVYGGLCRFGRYNNGTVLGWMQVICLDPPDWDYFGYKYLNYKVDPYTVNTFESGWLDNYVLQATVPMVYHPSNNDHMFNMSYHIPMGIDTTPGVWEQRNCSGGGGFWTSNGLNLMCPNAAAFTADGRLVIGSGDFAAFAASDIYGSSFEWLSRWAIGSKDVFDVETIGNDIYVVRTGPRKGDCFGYDTYIPEDQTYPFPRQTQVIAKYNPDLCDVHNNQGDGYCWEFLSRDFDSVSPYTSGTYKVSCFEIVHEDTMYAVVSKDGFAELFRATKEGTSWVWDTTPWWAVDDWGRVSELLYIPNTTKLIVLVYNASNYKSGVWAVDTQIRNTAQSWLQIQESGSYKRRMVRGAQTAACDANGEYLYIGSCGNLGAWTYQPGTVHAGGVLRLAVPRGSTPTEGDWEVLLNDENGQYVIDFETPYFPPVYQPWGSNPLDIAGRLTDVQAIVVDPVNPLHIWIGMGDGPCLHPNNGVWEFVPPGTTGGTWQWVQRTGNPTQAPSFRVRTLGLSPVNPSLMFIGTGGTEYFRMTVTPSSTPTVAAVSPLHAGQTLLLVAGAAANGSEPLVSLVVDATPLGLGENLVLNDSGEGADCQAGDGVWTVDLGAVTAQPGSYALPVVARDGLGYTLRGDLEVEVTETPAVYYRNASAESDLDYQGTPTGIVSFDLPNEIGVIDGQREVFYSQLDDVGRLYRHLGIREGTDDVPSFRDATEDAFPLGQRPGFNHGPAVAADLNNDGLDDLIVAAGHNGTFRIYLQSSASPGTYTALAVPSGLGNSWSVACGDYDLDGQLDIYVGRADVPAGCQPGPGSATLPDVLLRNDLVNSGTFVDVTASALVPAQGSADLATSSAAWCDFDHDGDMDLVVTDISGGKGIRIFVNESGILQEQQLLVLPDPENIAYLLSDVAWIDLDGDGDFDVVATSHSSNVPTCTFVNNGNATFTFVLDKFPLPAEAPRSGLRALDHNLDGYLDVLLLPAVATEPPQLMVNRAGEDLGFRTYSAQTGLAALIGEAYGAVVTDLNGDGASELLMGRAIDSAKFLCTARGDAVAGQDPANWVGLRLFQPEGTGQAAAVGTRVVLHLPDNQNQALQVAGGGNGRADHTFLLGVGSASTLSCTIYWASGRVQTGVSLTLNAVNEITEPVAVAIPTGSTSATYELRPDATIDWIFRWSTDVRTDLQLDQVNLDVDGMGAPCHPMIDWLRAGDSGVECRQWRDTSGVFRHELRWKNRPCIPCVYDFTAESGRHPGSTTTSESKTLRIKLCIAQ